MYGKPFLYQKRRFGFYVALFFMYLRLGRDGVIFRVIKWGFYISFDNVYFKKFIQESTNMTLIRVSRFSIHILKP